MDKLKEIMKNNAFIRKSIFIFCNAALLYILYFVMKNIGNISSSIMHGLDTLLEAFSPLVIGLILAYLLNPLASLIDNKLMRKVVKLPSDPIKSDKRQNQLHLISVIITYLLVIAVVIAIIYGFAMMIIGRVVFTDVSSTMQDLMDELIKYEAGFKGWIANNIPNVLPSGKVVEFTNYIMNQMSENVSTTSIIGFFTNIGGSVIDILIGIIISIYLMKDKKFFLGLWRKFLHLLLPQKGNAILAETLNEINVVFSKFIRGAMLDALFVAILSSIGLSVLGLQAAVFIGIFAGIANVIPYFGPALGMIPAFLMGLCTDGFWHGAFAVLVLLLVQQIDSNIIYPKIVGTSTGLHPLMVLLAVSVFGYFGGIPGMLLAVPLAGIIQIFVVKWANNKEAKIKSPESCSVKNKINSDSSSDNNPNN